MTCAHKFLSSSVNNVTHISTLHEESYFILAEVQTKEKASNRNRTQPEKQNHTEKKNWPKKKTSPKKINLSKSREKQTQHCQVFLKLIYFCWSKLMANHIFFNYYFINSSSLYFISRWFQVVPSSSLMHFGGWYSSRPAREEKSQT